MLSIKMKIGFAVTAIILLISFISCNEKKSIFDNQKSKLISYPADYDTEFNKGSKIDDITVTPKTIDDLSVLGKVWGFLKYYHPEIAKGNVNWDFELFRILPKILNCKDKDAQSKILLEWIEKLGKVKYCSDCKEPHGKDVKMYPDLDWLYDKDAFSEKFIDKLDYIRKNRNQGGHYYIDFTLGAGNVIFNHEAAYPNMNFKDVGFRILALFRYWNMIQYFFPYKYAIGEDWKNVLNEFIPKIINADTEYKYKIILIELITRINDSHANIGLNSKNFHNYKGTQYPSVEVKWVENKFIVSNYFDEKLGKKTKLLIGDMILAVDGKKVEDIVKTMLPLTPASNYPTKMEMIAYYLLRGNSNKVEIEYKRNNKNFKSAIDRYEILKAGLFKKLFNNDTCFKLLSNDIAYLNLLKIKKSYLFNIKIFLQKTKALIIDIRNYPTDNVLDSLADFLMPKRTQFERSTKTSIKYPGLFLLSPILAEEFSSGNPDFYKGKVIILVNGITISGAEFLTMALQKAPKAIVIGSTTSAADGNVSEVILPGDIHTWFSAIGIYYPDGRETQRVGIVPDIEVKPTIKGIKEGRDEALEKAIEVANGK
jgi:C-terminal processing protease CtpA/Prc